MDFPDWVKLLGTSVVSGSGIIFVERWIARRVPSAADDAKISAELRDDLHDEVKELRAEVRNLRTEYDALYARFVLVRTELDKAEVEMNRLRDRLQGYERRQHPRPGDPP